MSELTLFSSIHQIHHAFPYRAKIMQIDNIKTIPIKDYLRNKGIYPAKEYSGYGMYKNPYREESTASLKVDYKKNLCHDFGSEEGGSIIDLVMKMQHCSFIQAIDILSYYDNNGISQDDKDIFSFHRNNSSLKNETSGITLINVKALGHPKLLAFLQSREVNLISAKTYCKEVHYQIRGRNYYAVGFVNDQGGYALRNPYFKNCVAPNHITTFDRETNAIHLLEGFIDYLSLLTLQPEQEKISALVLNSVNNFEKAVQFLSKHKQINAFLDNDNAGKRVVEKLQQLQLPVKDYSKSYNQCKDLNDFLRGKKLSKSHVKTIKSRGIRR